MICACNGFKLTVTQGVSPSNVVALMSIGPTGGKANLSIVLFSMCFSVFIIGKVLSAICFKMHVCVFIKCSLIFAIGCSTAHNLTSGPLMSPRRRHNSAVVNYCNCYCICVLRSPFLIRSSVCNSNAWKVSIISPLSIFSNYQTISFPPKLFSYKVFCISTVRKVLSHL